VAAAALDAHGWHATGVAMLRPAATAFALELIRLSYIRVKAIEGLGLAM
jgi:hypothetical protein